MKKLFPSRWEVSNMQAKFAGAEARGTIRIHCTADDKNFLSDFDARLDAKGNIKEFFIDGLSLKDKIERLDAE